MNDIIKTPLPKAKASYGPSSLQWPKQSFVPGLYLGDQTNVDQMPYHDVIRLCRHFYERDPIAGTVINRMASMSVTNVRNRWKGHTPAEKKYWTAVAEKLRTFFKSAAIEYFVHGMVIPEYTLTQKMGKLFDLSFGRKKMAFPEEIACRDVTNILLRKRPASLSRAIFIKIPVEDIEFIQNEGVRSDGMTDREGYDLLLANYPEYVAAVKAGIQLFPLVDIFPMMRNIVSYDAYPAPFLRNALNALQHKEYLKLMDRKIASRAIDAIRHVKIGSDEFPADDTDISDAQTKLSTAASYGDSIFNLYTNHTWNIDWIIPPLDVLVNEAKYSEPNADIFLAMGFPRVLTVGETAKSNSSDAKIALLGPVSTLQDIRDQFVTWAIWFYDILAKETGLIPPRPYLSQIPIQDITSLIQFASVARSEKAISRDTVSQLYGTTFEDELVKMQEEEQALQDAEMDKISELEKVQEVNQRNNPPGDNE